MELSVTELIQTGIIVGGVFAIIYAVFKDSTTKRTIQTQKDLIETLTAQVKELQEAHIKNEKDIAKLTGQVEVYKELPLSNLATSMDKMAKTQEAILKLLQKEVRDAS